MLPAVFTAYSLPMLSPTFFMFWVKIVQSVGKVIPMKTAGTKIVMAVMFMDWTFSQRKLEGVMEKKGRKRSP